MQSSRYENSQGRGIFCMNLLMYLFNLADRIDQDNFFLSAFLLPLLDEASTIRNHQGMKKTKKNRLCSAFTWNGGKKNINKNILRLGTLRHKPSSYPYSFFFFNNDHCFNFRVNWLNVLRKSDSWYFPSRLTESLGLHGSAARTY